MADAKALYKRHWKEFCDAIHPAVSDLLSTRAIIYAACIIAETIRTDVYDEPHRIIEVIKPEEQPKKE